MTCILCNKLNSLESFCIGIKNYYRCPQCNFFFMDAADRLQSREEKQRYELHQNSPQDLHYRAFLQPAFDISLSKISTASKGLDYGCGPGPTLSQMFLEKGVNMNIYDPYFYPNKNVLEKKYDFITCTEVVEHFYQPDHEFNTLFSLLKESGFLCIQTMFFESIQSLQSSHYPKDPTHVCFYGKTSLSYIAKKHHVQCEFPRQNLALFST